MLPGLGLGASDAGKEGVPEALREISPGQVMADVLGQIERGEHGLATLADDVGIEGDTPVESFQFGVQEIEAGLLRVGRGRRGLARARDGLIDGGPEFQSSAVEPTADGALFETEDACRLAHAEADD